MSYTSGLGNTIDVRPMNPDGSCPAGMIRITGGNTCFTDARPYGPPAAPPAAQQQIVRQQIPPSYLPPVPAWRQQIAGLLDSLGRLILTLPGEVIAQLMALLAGLGPSVRGEGDALRQALTDPTKSDREVAERLRTVNDRYRSLKPSLPAPAVRVIDPVIDGAINLVPQDVRPEGLAPLPPSLLDSVPWAWVAGSFVAGLFASTLFTAKKTTPNRRRRRHR